MKIAIVSDSHGSIDRIKILLSQLQKSGIQHVLHAGDFAVPELVQVFKKYPNIQIHIARGNFDVNDELIEELNTLPNITIQEVIDVTFEGIRIALSHFEGIAQKALHAQKVDIFCHGHTHKAQIAKQNGIILLNPGALCDDGKYFLLSVPDLKLQHKLYNNPV